MLESFDKNILLFPHFKKNSKFKNHTTDFMAVILCVLRWIGDYRMITGDCNPLNSSTPILILSHNKTKQKTVSETGILSPCSLWNLFQKLPLNYSFKCKRLNGWVIIYFKAIKSHSALPTTKLPFLMSERMQMWSMVPASVLKRTLQSRSIQPFLKEWVVCLRVTAITPRRLHIAFVAELGDISSFAFCSFNSKLVHHHGHLRKWGTSA